MRDLRTQRDAWGQARGVRAVRACRSKESTSHAHEDEGGREDGTVEAVEPVAEAGAEHVVEAVMPPSRSAVVDDAVCGRHRRGSQITQCRS